LRSNEFSVSIYPNPAHNVVNFQGGFQKADLKIFDVLGKEIINKCYSDNSQIDIEDFENGVYFIQLKDNRGTFSGKFIKG